MFINHIEGFFDVYKHSADLLSPGVTQVVDQDSVFNINYLLT